MDDLFADKADSEQNNAVAEMYAGSSKGNTENFVNGCEEILKHLTNTVKELTGPGSTLNSLMTSVKTLEQEVRALKRHNTSDEGVMSQKEARLDNSEGNAMEAQEETSGAKSSLDDIDSFLRKKIRKNNQKKFQTLIYWKILINTSSPRQKQGKIFRTNLPWW